MTDRERARLIGLLRDAARALQPASTFDAWLPERLRREADEIARGAYRNHPESPDGSDLKDASTPPFATKTACFCSKSCVNGSETPKGSRDDRRDHDRHAPRVL